MVLTFMADDKQFVFLTPVVLFTGMNVERFIPNPSAHIHITGLVPFNNTRCCKDVLVSYGKWLPRSPRCITFFQ